MAKLDLNVIVNSEEDVYQIVEFKGEMDKSNNLDVRNALNNFIENYKQKFLFFDLTYFDFVNSEGVGMLVSMYYKMKKDGKELYIINPQPQVEDVFNIIGLTKIVPIYPSIEVALEHIN
jgi:stage II sporulation protein AA (anti-sigma F factor antagonist)